MSDLKIKSYDSLVKKLEDKEQNAATVKMEKQEELRAKLGSSKIATIKAQNALEKAIVTSGESIDTAAVTYKDAVATEQFYTELYEAVFGKESN